MLGPSHNMLNTPFLFQAQHVLYNDQKKPDKSQVGAGSTLMVGEAVFRLLSPP